MTARRKSQSGQVMVLVALSLIALIGSVALVLLAGSAEWQKNQLQQVADGAALDAAQTIGIGCDSGKAGNIILAADNAIAAQRARVPGKYSVTPGTCAIPYVGNDTFTGNLGVVINYPYRAHQQQVEVILTLTLPISFGGVVGSSTTTIARRAVAQALPASTAAVSATTLTCGAGQVNVSGSIHVQRVIARAGSCAVYAHAQVNAASGTYSDLGNVSVYTDGQSWTAPGTCAANSNSGSIKAICSDGFELTGHVTPTCAAAATSFLLAGDKTINANPCAAGTARPPVPIVSTNLPPEPNADPVAIATLTGNGGAPCASGTAYPKIVVGGKTVATGLAAAPIKDPSGFYHFKPSCYGYLDPSSLSGGGGGGSGAVLDPGFYYFNGSGLGGGGGICLNGGTLLARGVTLEFVNRAGFSSGTCAAGGGSGKFGSTPCSVSACPPNAGLDSPNNLTWFAAPCSSAPAGDSASCPGPAWCTAGDRSCSNVLIWAPPSNTGQIAIKGAAAKYWLLGSVYWPGTCTDTVNGTSTIAGTVFCGNLTISAAAGAGTAIGGPYGIATSLVEAVLVE